MGEKNTFNQNYEQMDMPGSRFLRTMENEKKRGKESIYYSNVIILLASNKFILLNLLLSNQYRYSYNKQLFAQISQKSKVNKI